MGRRSAWVIGIIFGSMFLFLFGVWVFVSLASQSEVHGGFSRGERVGIVELIGPISDSKRTLKDLAEFKEADNVKAIVVRVDSPGGAVGPSQEIYDAIVRLREKKSVVVSMGSLAASGGFYIASAGEKVFANPGTLTGSIGVILQVPDVSGVLRWAGVEMNTITAGKMKDSGSPFRAMTDDERRYFHGVLSDVHEQFIEAVARGRKLTVDEVRPYADGRIFSGRQAKEWKLVDELGGIDAAVAEAGRLGGLVGEPKVVYPKRERNLLRELTGGEDAEALFQGLVSRSLAPLFSAGLQYRAPMGGAP